MPHPEESKQEGVQRQRQSAFHETVDEIQTKSESNSIKGGKKKISSKERVLSIKKAESGGGEEEKKKSTSSSQTSSAYVSQPTPNCSRHIMSKPQRSRRTKQIKED